MRPSITRTCALAGVCTILLLLPLHAGAQQPAGVVTPSATAHESMAPATAIRRVGTVQVDGRLDEPAWQMATPITDFTQYDPNEGEPASERTEARFLVDDEALYVGLRMFDSDPAGIQKQLARRDEGIDGDLVEIYLDSYHDHLNAYLFRLSPAGARRDATLGPNFNDASWDAVWEGKTSVDSLGWIAEFRIPLSQLRFDPTRAEQTWGVQIGRKIARKGEVSFFAHTPRSEQGGVHRYRHLMGLGKLASPQRLELTPYALAKTENPVVATNDPFRSQNQVVPGAGLDLKYGITSNLTLDATFNPDFGQVEVDPAVVNLSAFETFYPERRPFFVEGASIFDFGSMRTNNSSAGYTFLHTRRIGRRPQRGVDGDDIAFVDAPLETTITGAAKLTGRSAKGWSIGLLDAVTSRERARFRLEDGSDGHAIVEPRTNYFAGRIKRDLRQGNTSVGIGVTSVHRDLGDEELRPLFRSSAYAAGFDWMHAWANRRWAFDGAVVLTHNRGSADAIRSLQVSPARYYQRPDREDVLLDPTRTSLTGHMAEVTLAKLSGKWRGSLTAQDYSPGFEINEAGFLGETDVRGIAPLVSYQENTPNRIVRRWAQFLFWNPTWNYDGDVTFLGVGAINEGEFRNFWSYFLRADHRPRVIDPGLTRGGPVVKLSTGGSWEAELTSDRRKRYTAGFYMNRSWNAAGGLGATYAPSVAVRPSTALRITLSPTYSKTHAMAQYVGTFTDATVTDTYGARYVFATLEQEQFSMVTRVDWTFTPTLSLQIFAQPLVAAGDFVDYKELARPRDFAFDIYGRDLGTIQRDDATGRYTVDPDGSGAIPSFSFADRDFNQRSLRGNAVLRWEYRPGSALFFVWQQSRFEELGRGEFGGRRDLNALWGVRPENVFVVKGTWWVGR